jgi:hypothetical protein
VVRGASNGPTVNCQTPFKNQRQPCPIKVITSYGVWKSNAPIEAMSIEDRKGSSILHLNWI